MAAFVAVTTVPTQAKAAAGSEKHVLKLGTTYSNYDITGDGEADTIKVSTYAEDKYVKENGDLDHLKITVNGVTAYDKKFHGFSSADTTLLVGTDASYLVATIDTGYDSNELYILSWDASKEKIEQCIEVSKEMMYIGNYLNTTLKSFSEDKVVFSYTIQSESVGMCKGTVGCELSGGNAKLASRKRDIKIRKLTYKNGIEQVSYKATKLTAKNNIKIYKDVNKKKVVTTLKKNQKITVSKVYFNGKKVMLYGKTSKGKKGWFVSKYGIFKEVSLAG